MSDEQARADLRRFFQILKIREESDSGTVFSPVYISCCRVLLGKELNEILPRLEEWAGPKDAPNA